MRTTDHLHKSMTGTVMAPNGRAYSMKRNGQVVRAIPKPWTCKAERKWMKKQLRQQGF